MRRMLAIGLGVFALTGGTALAANPGTGGQPNQDCEQLGATMPAPFADPTSAFTLVAGAQYADGQLTNPTAVSQYDVACFETTTIG